jgi:tetratricopeptide (TPR) repeat protein
MAAAGAPVPRDLFSRQSGDETYRQGLALYEAGRLDEAVPLLQSASTAPGLRFATSSLLGRIFRDRGAVTQAIEWFERAAQAPAPTPEEGHALLFDLAEALEGEGETARALAICMELQADAGNYRDVAARIDRLARVRVRE